VARDDRGMRGARTAAGGEAVREVECRDVALQWHTGKRMLGLPSADPVSPVADDARFVDPVWTASPTWDLVKEWYLAFT